MLSHFESPLDVNKQHYMIKDTYIKELHFFRIARTTAHPARGFCAGYSSSTTEAHLLVPKPQPLTSPSFS
jgi:hypothetical protein